MLDACKAFLASLSLAALTAAGPSSCMVLGPKLLATADEAMVNNFQIFLTRDVVCDTVSYP